MKNQIRIWLIGIVCLICGGSFLFYKLVDFLFIKYLNTHIDQLNTLAIFTICFMCFNIVGIVISISGYFIYKPLADKEGVWVEMQQKNEELNKYGITDSY